MDSPPPQFVYRGCKGSVTCLAAYKDLFISGDSTGHIYIWDRKTKRRRLEWNAHHSASVLHIAVFKSNYDNMSDDSEQSIRIVSQGRDHIVRVSRINLKKWNRETVLKFPHKSMSFCRFDLLDFEESLSKENVENFDPVIPLGHILVVPSSDSSFDLLHLKDSTSTLHTGIAPFKDEQRGTVTCLKLLSQSAHGDVFVAAGYESGHLTIWKASPSNQIGCIVTVACFKEPGKFLL